jgi:hypothetical protein
MSTPNIFSLLLSRTQDAVAALAKEAGQKPRELRERVPSFDVPKLQRAARD